jgi:nuclear pore complex protein Nup155
MIRLPFCRTSTADVPRLQMMLSVLPNYVVATGGVIVSTVTSLSNGRIFLGAADGHIYELLYKARGHCRLCCVAASFLGMLCECAVPDALAAALYCKPRPITALVMDRERGLLYTLQQDSTITVC